MSPLRSTCAPLKNRLKLSAAVGATIAAMMPTQALAQAANVSAANVEVFNLLSPFLSLNATPTGQATLTSNLNAAVSVNNAATPAQQALSIIDEILPSGASNTLTVFLAPATPTVYATNYGVAANLGGVIPGGPVVNGIKPAQKSGGLGSILGAIYVQGVNAYAAGDKTVLPGTVAFLTSGYNFTASSVGSKSYFANGTTNGVTLAVAPAGSTLPTFNGLPNATTSVYDTAYGVSNATPGQNPFGDSRPYQVAPKLLTQYDPNYNAVLSTNSSFPSGHTNYGFTDSVLLAMIVPQEYQSLLSRAAEYGNSRIVLGAHYPLDIIASRAFSAEQLAQAFTNPSYVNNAAQTGFALNLPSLFKAANTELNGYLQANCGAAVTVCAASPANANALSPSAANAATYAAELTYGLPTLTYAAAPREQAAAAGPDASILLATVYGGDTTAAKTIAPNGGLYGSLSTGTINQIIVNTEGQAFASFYGAALSYWSRINLYAAVGYFSGVTGTLSLASNDVVTTPVTVASGGTLGGTGTIVGATTIAAGGALAPGLYNTAGAATGPGALTINGALTFAPGSTFGVQVGATASAANVSGLATLGGAAVTATIASTGVVLNKYTIITAAGGVGGAFGAVASAGPSALTGAVSYDATHAYLNLGLNYAQTAALTVNQANVGAGLSRSFSRSGSIPTAFAALGPSGLSQASGEVATGVQTVGRTTMDGFLRALFIGGVSAPGSAAGAQSGGPLALAEPTAKDFVAADLRSRPPLAPAPLWTVWGQVFGERSSTSGDAALGSNSITTRAYEVAAGATYHASPDTQVGFGLGGGGASFGLANGLGSGRADLFQIGIYGVQYVNSAYVAAAFAYGAQADRTNRTAAALGDQLQAKFNTNTFAGRLEIGDRISTPALNVTPLAAVRVTSLSLPAYAERSLVGGPAALSYAAQTVTDPRTELGVRFDHTFVMPTSSLNLLGKIAWAHDFNAKAFADAAFLSLPGAQFRVNGATPAANAALVAANAELDLRNGFAALATFEGEFSRNTNAYAARGTLRYTW